MIRWSYCSPVAVNPGADGILDALERSAKQGEQWPWAMLQSSSHAARPRRMGPTMPPVTLVEYGDYECPHCGAAHPVVKLLQQRLRRQLRFVFRHFPLSQIHPNAEPAAEAAEICRRAWPVLGNARRHLSRTRIALGLPLLFALRRRAWSVAKQDCGTRWSTGTYEPKVRSDFLGGVRSGVNGTPTFFINGERHDGTYALEDLSAAIDAHLPVKAVPLSPFGDCFDDRRRFARLDVGGGLAMIERAEQLHRQFFRAGLRAAQAAIWEPPVDIFETDRELWIIAALPGVEPDDLDVSVEAVSCCGSPASAGCRPRRARPPSIAWRFPMAASNAASACRRRGWRSSRSELVNGCLVLSLTKRD